MSEATRFARQPHFYHILTVTPTAPPSFPYRPRHSRENGNLGSADLVIQICPRGISPLNQFNLPWPIPFLERLLTTDGAFHGSMDFIPDQPVYSISLRKPFDEVISMEPYTLHKIGCHSDVNERHSACLQGCKRRGSSCITGVDSRFHGNDGCAARE